MKPPAPSIPPAEEGPAASCIGVFDSGVGGLSVLRSLRQQLPGRALLYFADSAHAPYGDRSGSHVIDRSQWIAQHLLAEGAGGLVIACNTATALAAGLLRKRWPQLPIVGVEPGIKPAVAASRNGRIGVLATPATLRSERFRRLLHTHASNVALTAQPCPGLAQLIEQGDLADAALRSAVQTHCDALRRADVDTVVLGCTHYAFVRHLIEAAMGPCVRIVETAEAVARQAARLWAAEPSADTAPPGPAVVRLQTTGDAARLRDIACTWLDFPCRVEAAHAQR